MDKTPAPQLINAGQTCRHCAHVRIRMAAGSALQYQCVKNPPVPVAAAQISPRGDVSWIANGFFPPIGDPDDTWCSQFSPKVQN